MINDYLKEFAMEIKKISRTTVQKTDVVMSGKRKKKRET